MAIKLAGIYPAETKPDYPSIKVPVFLSEEGKFVIQRINEQNNRIIEFMEVGNIKLRSLTGEYSNIIKNIGEEAVFGLELNNELKIDTKEEIDIRIISLLESSRLSGRNLYSLYVFLRIPKLIEKAIDIIIEENELNINPPLTRDNFVILNIKRIQQGEIETTRKILQHYLPSFLLSKTIDCFDIITVFNKNEPEKTFTLGMYEFPYTTFVKNLYFIAGQLNQEVELDKNLNDLILNILLIFDQPMPDNASIHQYFFRQNIFDLSTISNQNMAKLTKLLVRCSTGYYTQRPSIPVSDESFSFKSYRIENAVPQENQDQNEYPVDERIDLDLIKKSILQSNAKAAQ